MPDRLFIFDTTLRDGEQKPDCPLNSIEKIQVAKSKEVEANSIEAGFPVSSSGDFNSMGAISRAMTRPGICVLSCAVENDIDLTDKVLITAKRKLKIKEIITRCNDREYGSTQISYFHDIRLFSMSFLAREIKFI
jgi:isopropylmalate/homocitrate/citramalate synthase